MLIIILSHVPQYTSLEKKLYIYIYKQNETETKQAETKQNKKNETRRTVDVAPVISNLYIT